MQKVKTIRDKALLVAVHARTWAARKASQQAITIVTEKTGAKRSSLAATKRLIDSSAHKDILRLIGQTRKAIHEHTMPWSDNAQRLVTVAKLPQIESIMRSAKDDLDELVRKFEADYPDIVETARRDLGSLFDPMDYPSANEIAERFVMDLDVSPIPDGAQFDLLKLGQSDIDDMTKSLERDMTRKLSTAMLDPYRRMVATLDSAGASWSADAVRIHASVTDNLKAMADNCRELDLTGSPDLASVLDDIEKIATQYQDSKALRDESVRAEAKQQVEMAKQKLNDKLNCF